MEKLTDELTKSTKKLLAVILLKQDLSADLVFRRHIATWLGGVGRFPLIRL